MPTCHLRPVLVELMRGLGPHAQPWDRAPTPPPAGTHHTSTLIWKTWQRQGGIHAGQKPHWLSTCKGMWLVCLAIPSLCVCVYTCVCKDAFMRGWNNKGLNMKQTPMKHSATQGTGGIIGTSLVICHKQKSCLIKGNQEAQQVWSPRKDIIWGERHNLLNETGICYVC